MPALGGERGLDALRAARAAVLFGPEPVLATPGSAGPRTGAELRGREPWLLSLAEQDVRAPGELRTASAGSPDERHRLIALVELARDGDKDAFGELFEHYHRSIYRFLYYRVGSVPVAEDLMAETFVRALRNMTSFQWQGRDFGAWLTTIARNLATDHFKAGRTRLERTTEDMTTLDSVAEGTDETVLSKLTNEALLEALAELPDDQRDCLVMRFLQERSIAETAEALERSTGAIKQLQLRAIRSLAQLIPEGLRP